MSGSKFNFVSH